MQKSLKKENAITLIALVITIIVLLILAGVSIAMLTGKNGILTQAQKAKEQTEYKSAEEKVQLAIIGAMVDDGEMTVPELKREVGYQKGIVTGNNFPVKVEMDGYIFTVYGDGSMDYGDNSNLQFYRVLYEFVVQSPRGKELPNEVIDLLPVDAKEYAEGETIYAIKLDTTEVTLSDGVWTFVGYDENSKVANTENADGGENVTFTGKWVFVEHK